MSIKVYDASGNLLTSTTMDLDSTTDGTNGLTTKAPTSDVFYNSARNINGTFPTGDDSSIGDSTSPAFLKMLALHADAGSIFTQSVSTYTLVYTVANAYIGGVLAPNGDIHMVPYGATMGQKISSAGVVSTYSLVYTAGSYVGGVLAPNGDIHFVPRSAPMGQKISSAGVVSTYTLVYTAAATYYGGVLAPNGDIHFVPYSATMGQKISSTGVVSTYSLVYTVASAYIGGVLSPNGDIHFIPLYATVGQKISTYPAKPFSINMCLSGFFNKL